MSGRWAQRIAVLLLGALAAACSGGPNIAGIDGGGFAVQGPITRFGSIFVNGVEYSISNANIVVGGQPATPGDLRVGQLVTVTGTQSPGAMPAAARVDFEPTLIGPVQSVNADASTLIAAGTTVRVTGGTSYDATLIGIESLSSGDFVEVSGYRDANGVVIASRIDTKPPGQVEVRGVVANLNAALETFTIGSVTVDYSVATSLQSFPSGGPAAGDLVEAQGTLSGATLSASRLIRQQDAFDAASSAHVQMEGAVTTAGAPGVFDIGSYHVATNAATQYENGTASDLAVSRIVEVEGSVDASGTLVADRVAFRKDGGLQLTGPVQSVDAGTQRFELLGMTITVNSLTRFEDKSTDTERFSVGDINVGDYLLVRAYQNGTDTIATHVTREPAQAELDLRGVLSAPLAPQFTLLGQTVLTDGSTRFRNVEGADIDQATFFSLAAVGSHDVRVKGTPVQGTSTVNAADVRLED